MSGQFKEVPRPWRQEDRMQPDAYSGAAVTAGGMINSDPVRVILEALGQNPDIAQKINPTPMEQVEQNVLPQAATQVRQEAALRPEPTEQQRIMELLQELLR